MSSFSLHIVRSAILNEPDNSYHNVYHNIYHLVNCKTKSSNFFSLLFITLEHIFYFRW